MVSYFALKLFCGFFIQAKMFVPSNRRKNGRKIWKTILHILTSFCGTTGVRVGRADIVKFISQYNNDGYKIYL